MVTVLGPPMGPKAGDTGLVDSGLNTLRPGGRGKSGQGVCSPYF